VLVNLRMVCRTVVVASETTVWPFDGFLFSHHHGRRSNVRFLCFRKFKIPLVHLSFYFVKETGKKRPDVCGNLELAFW